MTYICTEQLYLTKYHIYTSKSNSDGGHFELQNGGYTQIIYIYISNIFRFRYFTFVRTVIPTKMHIISILLAA